MPGMSNWFTRIFVDNGDHTPSPYRTQGERDEYPEEVPTAPPVFDAKEAKRIADQAKAKEAAKARVVALLHLPKAIAEIQKAAAKGKTCVGYHEPMDLVDQYALVEELKRLGFVSEVDISTLAGNRKRWVYTHWQ